MDLRYKYQSGKFIPWSVDLNIVVEIPDADVSVSAKIPTTNLDFLSAELITKINSIVATLNGQK